MWTCGSENGAGSGGDIEGAQNITVGVDLWVRKWSRGWGDKKEPKIYSWAWTCGSENGAGGGGRVRNWVAV
jgi:hypothetical protein